MTDQSPQYSVPPVTRAFRVLRYISEGNPCRNIARASKELDINRTTLLRLLNTLQDERMIDPLGAGGGYQLGTGLIHLAASALYSRDVVQVAQPELKALAVQLGLSAHLGILDGEDVLYLLRESPNLHLVSNVRVGSRLPAHATSIGRIILAHSPPEQLDRVLRARDLVAATPKTPVTPEALKAQLAEDKSIGIAWSVGNFESGIGSAASVILDGVGDVVGAVNVTGPEQVFVASAGRREDIAAALSQTTTRISHQMGHRPHAAQGLTS